MKIGVTAIETLGVGVGVGIGFFKTSTPIPIATPTPMDFGLGYFRSREMDDRMVFEQALDLAIQEEQAAADFYARMAEQVSDGGIHEIFKGFAREERAHKAKLEFIKSTGEIKPVAEQPIGLKRADYLAIPPSANLNERDALLLAMKKEKEAFKLYSALAASAPNDALRTAFSMLALEEANHKLRFEIAHDELLS
jgi:rubrerythrin